MIDEREYQIHPIVPESVAHNTRTLSNIRSLTSSLFGVAAGALGLESYAGFLFFLIGSLLVSLLIWALRADGLTGKGTFDFARDTSKGQLGGKGTRNMYFFKPIGDLWIGDLMQGLSGYVLTWTLVYGLCKA